MTKLPVSYMNFHIFIDVFPWLSETLLRLVPFDVLVACDLFVGSNLFHAVESAAGFEPFDLLLVTCVVQCNFVSFSVGMFDFSGNWFAWSKVFQSEQCDFIGWLNLKKYNQYDETMACDLQILLK